MHKDMKFTGVDFLEDEAYVERQLRIHYVVRVGKEWIVDVGYESRPESLKSCGGTGAPYKFRLREYAQGHADRVGGVVYEVVQISDSFMRVVDHIDFEEEAENFNVYDGLDEDN